MPQKTKQVADNGKGEEKKSEKPCAETNEKGNWSEDQQEKSYYYDDAYGYEIYNPKDDEDEENC